MKLSLKVVERKKNMNLRRNRCIELILVILGLTVDYVSGSSNSYQREKRAEKKVDPGERFFVTPYITNAMKASKADKAKILEEARNSSKATFPEVPDIVSYAGYFTVKLAFTAEVFFWYFPAQDDPKTAPVVLYLEAPFGDTVLSAAVQQNAPFLIEEVDSLKMREESWNKKQHMLYLDIVENAGYGFRSGTNSEPTIYDSFRKQILGALEQFFELFPSLQKNNFFLLGERWGAYWAMTFGRWIHYNLKKVNLKGIAVGNGWMNTESPLNFGEYLYESGLIVAKDKKIFIEGANKIQKSLNKSNYFEPYRILDKLFLGNQSQFNMLTGYRTFSNILEDRSSPDINNFRAWIEKNSTRRALHVGITEFQRIDARDILLNKDTLKQKDVVKLLNNYRVLIYTGNFDPFCSYPTVENWIDNLLPSIISVGEIKRAKRQKWIVDGEHAGYIRNGGNLTEVVIRNAGHYPAIDQPKYNRQLIESFTHGLL